MKGNVRTALLAAEFIVLFVGAPLIYLYGLKHINALLYLNAIAIVCLVLLLTDKSFERKLLWNAKNIGWRIIKVLALYILIGGGLFMIAYAWRSSRVLWFVKEHTRLWALVMVIYPLLSVYPQEIIYRAFLFHRYNEILRSPWSRIFVSAAAFGYMHIVFGNVVAVLLTVAGGMIFAVRYENNKSLLVTSIEHALYGWMIFTVGMGQFFLHGTMTTVTMLP